VSERAAALELAFRRIAATRMLDMPLRNPALRIESVGFREWQGNEVGVLITPWSISLIVFPTAMPSVRALTLDERRAWQFPSGRYEFMGGDEPECGPFHFCSLFSPPEEIADHAQAREIAGAVLEQLFRGGRSVSRRAMLGGAGA
jgi:[NiFe] hydrogenase assembly HybE family chaperone